MLNVVNKATHDNWDMLLIVIYPDFPLDLTGFFPGKHLTQFLANKMHDFRNFILHNCDLNFDAEQVHLIKTPISRIRKLQQTLNPKVGAQTLEKNGLSLNPKPETLNP